MAQYGFFLRIDKLTAEHLWNSIEEIASPTAPNSWDPCALSRATYAYLAEVLKPSDVAHFFIPFSAPVLRCALASLYDALSVRPSVRWLVGQFVGNPFFIFKKNGGEWSKITSHISAGFLFQPFDLILSFNLPFTIFLSQFFFHNLSFFHNLHLTIFSSPSFVPQSFLYNYSFTFIL